MKVLEEKKQRQHSKKCNKHYYISYKQYDTYIKDICTVLGTSKYAGVIGIECGGLPIAVHLKNLLKIPFYIISPGKFTSLPSCKKSKYLVVDDINDSGNTLLQNIELLKFNSIMNLETYAMVEKNYSTFSCTYYSLKLCSSDWVVFPWEK